MGGVADEDDTPLGPGLERILFPELPQVAARSSAVGENLLVRIQERNWTVSTGL